MKIVLFGASGMVGQGVLRECLLAPDVAEVLVVGRAAVGVQHPKLKDVVHRDLTDLTPIEGELATCDACFYCLGATAAGRTEAEYAAINHDLPLAAGSALARLRPGMTFVYVSGAGTDSTGQGRVMWARVKGRTENELLGLPLNAYLFRPAMIQPSHGEVSKTPAYRLLITPLRPVFPLLRGLFPGFVTTTERIGRAMLRVALHGYPVRILESRDINKIAQ